MKFSPAIFQRKLHRQLLSSLGVSLLLGGIAAVSLTYLTIRHTLKENILERAQAITRGLEFASEGLIETHDLYLLERLVQNYATLPAVLEISIVDPEGILIAHSDAFEVTSPNTRYADLYPELAQPLHQTSFNGIETNIYTVLHGKRVVVHLLPFSTSLYNQLGRNSPTSTNHRGVAIAVMDLQHMEQNALQSILLATLVITVSASLILVLMGYLIQRLILAPLTRIHSAILQSDYETHFSLPNLPNNEIGFLGKTLASAFEQLKTYQQLELETAERNYRAIAQRYELATHATKVWVWDWDRATDIFNIDQGLQQWLGHPYLQGGCPLHSWVEEIYPDDRDPFVKKLQACLAEETSELSCEYRLRRGECTPHWFLSRGKAVRDGKGKILRVIGTLTDITERKQVEAQLSQTNEELRCATRLKDEFLANMSHELRTPLNAILGMTEALQEGVYEVVNSQQAEALETIERSGFHLLELINDILDVAKIESGQMVLEFAPTSIQQLCQFSLSVISQQAQQKSIQIQVCQPPDLPALLVDERRIRQVLINLLNNAVKFTPKGGHITLEITSPYPDQDYSDSCGNDRISTLTQLPEQADERVKEEQATHPPLQSFLRIAVIDTGIGISPENIKKLFQPFIQIDSALNRRYEGTGLGLALVKRIVELHHGKVGVTSEVGVGSCFTIDLPCNATTPVISNSASPSEHTKEATSHKPNAPSLILLVEDNEANIFTISNYLRARGDRILSAQNGQEGIALARSEHPDLILMDIHLPGMNGLETIQILRRDPTLNPVPIIALTDSTVEGDRDRCLAAGATEYLSKPVKLKQLAALIQQLLPKES